MDRLEKALEKSRLQRSTVDPTFAKNLPPNTARSSTEQAPITPVANDLSNANEDIMERNRIIAHHTRSEEADIYRQLRTKVLQIMNKNGWRALAITSPHYGDGKTTVALNLGVSIAQDVKQTVLLVDLDLRKPNLHQYLGLSPRVGLTDHLLNNTPVAECLLRPPFERVNLLPGGTALENSSELLGTPKMAALANEVKNRYPDRLVIYDVPPVLRQDDSIAFLPHVDAVLVVVRDGVTSTQDLKRCLKSLSGANVIGTVLNNCW